jgi:hypothetical protein
MRIVRSALACIGVAGLVAFLGTTSVAHEPPESHNASHEGQKARHDTHHDTHHDAHRDNNRERRHEEPKKSDKETHHDVHHDAHHDEHRDAHHDHYYVHHENHPWWRSWHRPTERELTNWLGNWGWTAPVYYNYGRGGNVAYQNDGVYVSGARVGSAGEYANSLQTLASVAPSGESSSNDADWLPLGTFALLRQASNDKPSQVLQLSVNKGGAVSGVLFDVANRTTSSVRGSVDQKTQRVAFGLGENSGLVAETGIHNLTRDKVNLLVHQGDKKTQHYTLVRLQPPQGSSGSDAKID